jgi:hypothetical protein
VDHQRSRCACSALSTCMMCQLLCSLGMHAECCQCAVDTWHELVVHAWYFFRLCVLVVLCAARVCWQLD